MHMVHLFTARNTVDSKLPGKDLYFQGKVCLLDNLCVGPSSSLEKTPIHGVNKKLTRRL
jgi:hypothetical protein